jgi:hypothetical protein
MSLNNQSTQRNIIEHGSSNIHRGGSPKSRSEPLYVVVGATILSKICPRMRATYVRVEGNTTRQCTTFIVAVLTVGTIKVLH